MLEDWDRKPLDPFIRTFCQYVTTAQFNENDEHVEEALLHLIFGLDLLLGGKAEDALTQVLAERVAIISHSAINTPIADIIDFVKTCYDMRSGYVHRGQRGQLSLLIERLAQLYKLCRAVLGAACFARLRPWCQRDDARTAWLNRIDILRAQHKAGLAFNDADINELGLRRIHLAEGEAAGVSIEAPDAPR